MTYEPKDGVPQETREMMAALGQRGGRSRSDRKIAALKVNAKKARAARWPRGGRPTPAAPADRGAGR